MAETNNLTHLRDYFEDMLRDFENPSSSEGK